MPIIAFVIMCKRCVTRRDILISVRHRFYQSYILLDVFTENSMSDTIFIHFFGVYLTVALSLTVKLTTTHSTDGAVAGHVPGA